MPTYRTPGYKPRYDDKFKKKCLRLMKQHSVYEVASMMEVSQPTLYKWKAEASDVTITRQKISSKDDMEAIYKQLLESNQALLKLLSKSRKTRAA